MMTLMTTTDFVLTKNEFDLFKYNADQCRAYAAFLKTPLELWMFVPCDEYGKVLPEPTHEFLQTSPYAGSKGWVVVKREYEKAKNRVLFKGDWSYSDILSTVKCYKPVWYEWDVRHKKTIESIAIEKMGLYSENLYLTSSALKLIGIPESLVLSKELNK